MKFTHHVFVCTNERPSGHPRGCCHAKNSEELLKALKLEAAQLGLGKSVRVQRSGCLDFCEKGATLVVYPEGTWYGGVELKDVKEIAETHLKNGKTVERLTFEP